MADSTLTLSKTLKDWTKKFAGVSQFRWCSKRQALAGSGSIEFLEVPILRDSVTFQPAEPSLEHSYVYGTQIPWISVLGEPGDSTIELTLAAVDDALLELGFKKTTVANGITETATTHPSGKAGSWAFSGVDLTPKMVEGMLWVIAEDNNYSFMVKNFRGFAQPVLLDGTNPNGIRLVGSFTTPVDGDTDGDVLFGTYTPSGD